MAPTPDLKTSKKDLQTALGKARSGSLNFAFLLAKDGAILETDPRKSPDALWALARKTGGAGKGAHGVMSFESGKLVLRCEADPPAPLFKGFKAYLTERGQSIKFAFEGPANEDHAPQDTPDPDDADSAALAEEETPAEGESPPPPPPADTDTDAGEDAGEDPPLRPEELDDEEPIAGLNIAEVITKARKKPLNAAWLVGTEGMVLRAHPRLPIDVMRRKAKADGGGPKGALGVLTVKGKVVTLSCEMAPPRSFPKLARVWLKDQGVAMKVVIALPDGSVMESGEAEADAAAPGGDPTPEEEVKAKLKSLTEAVMAKRDILTEQEEAKFARVLHAIALLADSGDVYLAEEGLARAEALLARKKTPAEKIAEARADLAQMQGKLTGSYAATLSALLDRTKGTDEDTVARLLALFHQKLRDAEAQHAARAQQDTPAAPFTYRDPLPDPVAPLTEGVSDARKQALESWLDTYGEYDNAWQFGDDEGGEYLSAALLGKDATLGALTEQEKLYLSLKAADLWRKAGTSEHIREAAEGVAKDAEARRLLALGFASYSANLQRTHDTGMKTISSMDAAPAQFDMFSRALDLDSAAVLQAFKGAEVSLAMRVSGFISSKDRQNTPEEFWPRPMDLGKRTGLVEALANGALDAETTDKVGTTFFMAASEDDLEDPAYRKAMAKLLGQLASKDDPEAAAARLEAAMNVSGVREMLTAKSVAPEMRNWALVQIAKNPDMTPEKLKEGWESETISQAMAAPVLQRYQGRGTEPHEVVTTKGQDGALRNSIGQAMGLPMSPLGEETVDAALRRQDAGMDHDYYAGNKRIDDISAKIREETGGAPAKMTVIPVVVTSPEIGVFNVNVFRLDMGPGKPARFVDDFAMRYNDFEHWRTGNKLPPGKMTYPAAVEGSTPVDLALDGKLITENTPVKVDTFWEWVGFVGDGVALLAGIGVGVAVIVGTGGTATPFVVGAAAGVWTAGRAGKRLYDDSERGVDISDLSNPENRANWLEAGAGVLSVAAMGAPKLLATGAKGAQMSTGAARATAALQMTAEAADAAAMTDQAVMMATNWDKMSDGEKAMGMLNFAFWGGMTAASAKAGGGRLRDGASFTKLSNQLEFGSPFRVAQHPDLPEGKVRVAYDVDKVGGTPTNIRIETGGGTISPEMLDLHTNVGRQIEASGALSQQLKAMLADNPDPPIGSKGWEAKLEIEKIAAESELLRLQAESGTLSQTDLDAITFRQRELADATAYHFLELKNFDGQGTGWIDAPSRGSEQAKALGWPVGDDLPPGHHWLATQEGTPVLRRVDTNAERMRYNPDHKPGEPKFVPSDTPPVDVAQMIAEARARLGDQPVIPDTTMTSREAFQEVQNIRGSQTITDSYGGRGTVSVTKVMIGGEEKTIVGLNSSNLSDAEKALAKHWDKQLGNPPGKKGNNHTRQMLYHAEAHTLMQIHQQSGGNVPPILTIYVDRIACSHCQITLHELVKAMNMDTLRIVLPDGRQAVVTKDGFFGDW